MNHQDKEEKCKCENLEHGDIVPLDEDRKCITCGKDWGFKEQAVTDTTWMEEELSRVLDEAENVPYTTLITYITNLIAQERAKEREKFADMILDVIQDTDWIEQPKSAFGRLNKIFGALKDKQHE